MHSLLLFIVFSITGRKAGLKGLMQVYANPMVFGRFLSLMTVLFCILLILMYVDLKHSKILLIVQIMTFDKPLPVKVHRLCS